MANAEKHKMRSHRSYRDRVFVRTAQINKLWKSASTKTRFEKGILSDVLTKVFGKLFSRKRGRV